MCIRDRATWIELLNEIQADEQYGLVQVTDASPLVMIEYSSPNTNKPVSYTHLDVYKRQCNKSVCSDLVGKPVDGPPRCTFTITNGSSPITARFMASLFKQTLLIFHCRYEG